MTLSWAPWDGMVAATYAAWRLGVISSCHAELRAFDR
jgi:hypothetical protein